MWKSVMGGLGKRWDSGDDSRFELVQRVLTNKFEEMRYCAVVFAVVFAVALMLLVPHKAVAQAGVCFLLVTFLCTSKEK